jgi:hypothetical protein
MSEFATQHGRLELHVRPMILPFVRGHTDPQHEVDLWIRHPDGTAEVLLELIAPNGQQTGTLIDRLMAAAAGIVVIRE